MIKKSKNLTGAWSATPTPLTESLKIDAGSVKSMVEHHIRLKQTGLFTGGTCGEGPFLSRNDFRKLTTLTVQANKGQMVIAVQVTDNSYMKVLDNINAAKEDGADIAVIAEPWFCACVKEDVMFKYYMESIEKSKLPVCIYSRGAKEVPAKLYKKILVHPNVCMFKDSSCNQEIMKIALNARKSNKSLKLMTGFELGMVPYLKAGYDGVLAGGGIIIGNLTAKMVEDAQNGNFENLDKLQKHCDKINYAAYGGKKITSWLTGLKYTLFKMGIFKTYACYLKFPLPKPVITQIDKMIKQEKEILLP